MVAGQAEDGSGDRSFDRPDELERLYYGHVRAVSSYVAHHHLHADVDDVVQETFIVAGRKLAHLEPGKERAWLLAIARNVARNARKRTRRRHESVAALVAARPTVSIRLADEQLLSEQTEPLRRALASLTERDREVLLLAGWDGLSTAEIADVIGTTPQRASDRLYKARARFRRRFAQETLR